MEVFLMMKLFVSGTEGQAYQEFQGRDLKKQAVISFTENFISRAAGSDSTFRKNLLV